MQDNKYGYLLNTDIKLHRSWFIEMCGMLGINVIYKKLINPKDKYEKYGEIKSNYEQGELTGCIFEEHPTIKTMKKLGWNTELQENESIIHVPYDLDSLQQGCLFIIPSGLDKTIGRLFRVVELSTTMIYPASIACKIVPEYESSFDDSKLDLTNDNFNLLTVDEE